MQKEHVAHFQARWADMDFNGHMKNTAYLDYAADTRMLYFKENGFTPSEFRRIGIGPVVFSDAITYHRELLMYQEFSVSLFLAGMSEDGSRFSFVNDIRRDDGTPVATVRSDACWFSLESRKITAPPEEIMRLINSLKRTADFRTIDTSGGGSEAVA